MARRKTPKSERAAGEAEAFSPAALDAATVSADVPTVSGEAPAVSGAAALDAAAASEWDVTPAIAAEAEVDAAPPVAAPMMAAEPPAADPVMAMAAAEAMGDPAAEAVGEPAPKAASARLGDLWSKRTAAAGFLAARFSAWPRPQMSRAATVALAAGLGVVAGAMLSAGLFSRAADADQPPPVAALQGSVGALAAEIRALKDEFTAASRDASASLAGLAERLDRSEKVEADLAAKVAALSAPKPVAKQAVAKPLAKPPVAADVTGSIRRGDPDAVRRADPSADPAAAPAKVQTIARGWVLWRVQNGRALVHGNGRYYEVGPGSRIPGLGLVQRIGEENGRLFVATERGMILSGRG